MKQEREATPTERWLQNLIDRDAEARPLEQRVRGLMKEREAEISRQCKAMTAQSTPEQTAVADAYLKTLAAKLLPEPKSKLQHLEEQIARQPPHRAWKIEQQDQLAAVNELGRAWRERENERRSPPVSYLGGAGTSNMRRKLRASE